MKGKSLQVRAKQALSNNLLFSWEFIKFAFLSDLKCLLVMCVNQVSSMSQGAGWDLKEALTVRFRCKSRCAKVLVRLVVRVIVHSWVLVAARPAMYICWRPSRLSLCPSLYDTCQRRFSINISEHCALEKQFIWSCDPFISCGCLSSWYSAVKEWGREGWSACWTNTENYRGNWWIYW